MDKRIIWFAVIILLIIGAIVFFKTCRKLDPKPITSISFTIDKRDILVGDSIYFEDKTVGATSWYWEFGDGATSIQQKGYNKYLIPGDYIIRLTINGTMKDSFVSVIVNDPRPGTDIIKPRTQITGPKKVFVGDQATFTDATPGAEHSNWQNTQTGEIKKDSKTFTTTFNRGGKFSIIVVNEKNPDSNGQGTIEVEVVEKKVPPPPPPPADPCTVCGSYKHKTAGHPKEKCAVCGSNKHITPDHPVKPCATCGSKDHKTIDHPVPIVIPINDRVSNDKLKAMFNTIAAGGNFSNNYKPVREVVKFDETIPVEIVTKEGKIKKTIYGFCGYLRMTGSKVTDVKSTWDNKFTGFTVIIE